MVAILHLSNVSFVPKDDDDENSGSRVSDTSETALSTACMLLGMNDLAMRFTTRQISAGASMGSLAEDTTCTKEDPTCNKRRGAAEASISNTITKPLQPEEAARARDSLMRVIYSHSFDWLLSRLNGALTQKEDEDAAGGVTKKVDGGAAGSLRTIGLLDIFGFERFEINSFEQLCINYANERLQQFFLHCIFKAEKEIHLTEGVPFPSIDFQDNQGCIDCIEKNPHGILRLLDAQCRSPAATPASFFDSVNAMHKASPFFKPVSRAKMRPTEAFIVSHYAGDVCYVAKGGSWLEKNNDTLPAELERDVAKSSVDVLVAIFAARTGSAEGIARSGHRSVRFNSVGRRFINDLHRLHTALAATDAHFIRCIKPSHASSPKDFDPRLVLAQLRSNGVFDAVELMKAAYPTRIRYESIHGRYAKLLPVELVGQLPPQGFCEVVALACHVERTDYALGLTSLFLRPGKGSFLEELVAMDTSDVVPLLENKIREYERRHVASQLIGNRLLTYHLRQSFIRKQRAAKMVQRVWRGAAVRIAARHLLSAAGERSAALSATLSLGGKSTRSRESLPLSRLGGDSRGGIVSHDFRGSEGGGRDSMAGLRLLAETTARQKAEGEAASLAAQVEALTLLNEQMRQTISSGHTEADEALKLAHAEVTELTVKLQAAEGAVQELRAELEVERRRYDEMMAEAADASSVVDEVEEPPAEEEENDVERFTVEVTREEESGTLGVDIDVWEGRVTVASIEPNVPAAAKLQVGDQIEGVGGLVCGHDMGEVLKHIIESGDVISIQICRRRVVSVLRHEMLICVEDGEWQYAMCAIASNRLLTWELPVDDGEEVDETHKGSISLSHVAKLEMFNASADAPATLVISLFGGVYQLRYVPSGDEGVAGATAVLASWHEQMTDMLNASAAESHDSMIARAKVFQQGYMEVNVGLDEWRTLFVVLNGNEGLEIYADQVAHRRCQAMRIITTQEIRKATRSTGLEFFEWGIQVHMIDDEQEMLEVRAPSHSEMNRWLSTLNLHTAVIARDTPRHRTMSGVGPPGAPLPTPRDHISSRDPSASASSARDDSMRNDASPLPSPARASFDRRRVRAATMAGAMPSATHAWIDASPPTPPPPSTPPPQNDEIPTQYMQVEIMAGWLSVGKESTLAIGNKMRFCRLMGMAHVPERGAPMAPVPERGAPMAPVPEGSAENLGHSSRRSAANLGSNAKHPPVARRSEYAGGTSRIENVMLVMLHHEDDALSEGRTVQLADVTDLRLLSSKGSKRMVIALYLGGSRKLRIIADGTEWIDELRLHLATATKPSIPSQVSGMVSSQVVSTRLSAARPSEETDPLDSSQRSCHGAGTPLPRSKRQCRARAASDTSSSRSYDAPAPATPQATPREQPPARKTKLSGWKDPRSRVAFHSQAPPLPAARSAWLEVADHRGGGEEEAGEFELMFVVLTAERVLELYADEEDVGARPPKSSIAMSKCVSPAKVLDDPPYNYEHAICIGATATAQQGSLWLCPDTPAESKAWLTQLNAS
uniref:Myosin motor domain-containing protein n=1 Tax=Haptolina brevifila TaxID=156173 RepID=A0A7S2DI49_9EUKA